MNECVVSAIANMDYSLIVRRRPASWQVANKVEICQLFSEFAIRVRVTSNVDVYFAHHSENVVNLSLFFYILRRIIHSPVNDNSLFAANSLQRFIHHCVPVFKVYVDKPVNTQALKLAIRKEISVIKRKMLVTVIANFKKILIESKKQCGDYLIGVLFKK